MKKRIDRQDIADVARRLRIEPAALAAVLAVECTWPRRKGFDHTGLVRILYERHIAWRLTKGDDREKLATAGLARAKWKRDYPKSNRERWRQLEKAREIVGDKAYEFASYGLPQIMGFNYKKAGYTSAREMAEAFATGEREQLEGLGRFLAANKRMIEALQKHHWARFARAYNGRGYKANRYDEKLKRAYERFSGQDWPHGRVDGEYSPWKPVAASLASPAPGTRPPDMETGNQPQRPEQQKKRPGLFAGLIVLLSALAGTVAAAWDWIINLFGG